MRKPVLFLAILTFFLGVIAPGCGFAWSGKYTVLEICSGADVVRIVLDENGAPVEQPNHTEKEKCPYCFQYQNLAFDVPQHSEIYVSYILQAQQYQHFYLNLVKTYTHTPLQARAPPALI